MPELLYPTEHRRIPLHDAVSAMLSDVGCKPTLLGFNYLARAIELVLEDSSRLSGIVKKVYATVAEEFSSTSSRVERNCRTAILSLWLTQPTAVLEKYFSCRTQRKKSNPTVKEFVAALCDKFMLDYYGL